MEFVEWMLWELMTEFKGDSTVSTALVFVVQRVFDVFCPVGREILIWGSGNGASRDPGTVLSPKRAVGRFRGRWARGRMCMLFLLFGWRRWWRGR